MSHGADRTRDPRPPHPTPAGSRRRHSPTCAGRRRRQVDRAAGRSPPRSPVWSFVVALWFSGGGIDGFAGIGGPMTEIGRLSGLVASYLLLIQVLLMARIPWLEGIWGQDVLARQHRLVGFTSFDLMLVHIVTITLGYAAAADTGVLHEIWLLVTVYPGDVAGHRRHRRPGRRGGHLDPRRPTLGCVTSPGT